MKKMWKLAIVEPCHLVYAGIAQTIARTEFARHIHCPSMVELWGIIQENDKIDLFILDVHQSLLPLCPDIEKLKHGFPEAFIVLLSDTIDHVEVTRALQADVHGFISKAIRPEVLIKFLELIVLGEHVFPVCALLKRASSPPNPDVPPRHNGRNENAPGKICGLSSREIEVLRSLGEGKSNKEIARQLEISDATVKVHVKAILRKLRVKNRTKAALWVTESGFADGPLVSSEATLRLARSPAREGKPSDSPITY